MPRQMREQRHAARQRSADQRQGGGVARRVGEVALARRRAAIVGGIDVRRAAGDQEAVEAVEQARRGRERSPSAGISTGTAAEPRATRVDIFVADAVESWSPSRGLQAGGDPDERDVRAVLMAQDYS